MLNFLCRSLVLFLLLVILPVARGDSAAPAAAPRKLALLIGISKYVQDRSPRPWPELNTDQELTALHDVLIRNYGFADRDIKVLRDHEATKARIRAAFQQHLIAQAEPGTVALFHFSGHGQQVKDENGDELDGLDESLVPYDAVDQSAAAGAKANILDDELGLWLHQLTAKLRDRGGLQGSITLTLDSCFSGTATRGILPERGHGWDKDKDGPPPTGRHRGRTDGPAGLLQEGEPELNGYVVLAAARSDQVAREHGGMRLFSHALIKALWANRLGSRMTYRMLRDRIDAEITSVASGQIPQVEGQADNLLFANLAEPLLRPRDALAVTAVDATTLRLAGGEVHGVTVGSQYALHTPGVIMNQESQVGLVEVFAVGTLVSLARTLPGLGAAASVNLGGTQALETQHAFGSQRLRVHFAGFAKRPDLLAALSALEIVSTQGTSPTDYQLQVSYDARRRQLEVRRPTAKKPLRVLPTDQSAPAAVEQILLGEWRWRFFTALHQDNPAAATELRLVPVDAPAQGTLGPELPATRRKDIAASSFLRLRPRDSFQLEMFNRSPNKLWVTVLALNDEGAVKVLFPEPGAPANSYLAADQRPHILSPRYSRVNDAPGGKWLIKAIVTCDHVDLSSIANDAPRSAQRVAVAASRLAPVYQPLSLLLALGVNGQRAVTANTVSTQIWGTAEAWLEIY